MTSSATVSTKLGIFTLIADNKGITRIILPETGRDGMKGKTDSGKNPFLKKAAQQVREYAEGKRTDFDFPLSLSGTDFQKKVWKIMRTIPYGRTISYGEIAHKLGDRKKARAVGGAANANPLPLVIPCHRVVGSDGSLTGFAGGLDLKNKLLQIEKNTEKK